MSFDFTSVTQQTDVELAFAKFFRDVFQSQWRKLQAEATLSFTSLVSSVISFLSVQKSADAEEAEGECASSALPLERYVLSMSNLDKTRSAVKKLHDEAIFPLQNLLEDTKKGASPVGVTETDALLLGFMDRILAMVLNEFEVNERILEGVFRMLSGDEGDVGEDAEFVLNCYAVVWKHQAFIDWDVVDEIERRLEVNFKMKTST